MKSTEVQPTFCGHIAQGRGEDGKGGGEESHGVKASFLYPSMNPQK